MREQKSRRGIAASAAIAAGLALFANVATAVNLSGLDPWPNGRIEYRVNVDSFNAGGPMNGLGINDQQARFWVRYAAEQWRWKTGADLLLTNEGDTNLGDSEADCYAKEGDNFIAVVPGCVHDENGVDNCKVLAVTSNTYYDNSKARVRSTMCIHGGTSGANPPDWEVNTENFDAGESDLVSVLVHEWGHWLGLGHYANAVMNDLIVSGQRTRYPTDDDIRGIRQLYPPSNQYTEYVRPVNASSLGAEWSVGSTSWAIEGATAALYGGKVYYIRAKPSPSGDHVHFTRAEGPLSSSSTWTTRSYSAPGGPADRLGSWASPGMAFGAGKVVAAFPNKVASYNKCSGIRVLVTTDLFVNVQVVDVNSCTFNNVAVAYDPTSRRFVMFYQHFDSTAYSNTDRVFARTSTDGINWTAAVNLGISTVHPVAAASNSSGSSRGLVYAQVPASPVLHSRSWSVNSAGTVVLGSSVTANSDLLLMPPSLGSRSNSANPFVIIWPDDDFTGPWIKLDDAAPFTPFDGLLGVSGGNTPSLMGIPGTANSYLIRTR